MRAFSEIEKEYISKLVDTKNNTNWSGLVLKNLIYSIFGREIIFDLFPGFEIKEGESESKDEKEGYDKAILEGYIPISIFLNLLEYLNSNALISIIPYFETADLWIEGITDNNNDDETEENKKRFFNISALSYLTFLKDNYSNIIYPSQELIDLVNSKFKSREERRYKKQIWTTWVSIGLAFFIGLVGFFKPDRTVELKQDQMQRIINELNIQRNEIGEVNALLDSINNKLIILFNVTKEIKINNEQPSKK